MNSISERIADLIAHPNEAPNAEYKTTNRFDGKNRFSLKLIKTCLAMANSGGGYVLIGFREEGGTKKFDGHMSAEIAKDYDVTNVNKIVSSVAHTPGEIRISVEVYTHDEPRCIVLQISSIADEPLICRSTKRASDDQDANPVLEEGAIYVRTHKAESRRVDNPEAWRVLISRCVDNRHDKLLTDFKALLDHYFGRRPPYPDLNTDELHASADTWFQERTDELKTGFSRGTKMPGFYSCSYRVHTSTLKWNLPDLEAAAGEAQIHDIGWPIGILPQNRRDCIKYVDQSVRVTIPHDANGIGLPTCWELGPNGSFDYLCAYQEDLLGGQQEFGTHERGLYIGVRLGRIAEILDHCSRLYRALELPNQEIISCKIMHHDLKGRRMRDAMSRARSEFGPALSAFASSTINAPRDMLLFKHREFCKECVDDLLFRFARRTMSDEWFESHYHEYEIKVRR